MLRVLRTMAPHSHRFVWECMCWLKHKMGLLAEEHSSACTFYIHHIYQMCAAQKCSDSDGYLFQLNVYSIGNKT